MQLYLCPCNKIFDNFNFRHFELFCAVNKTSSNRVASPLNLSTKPEIKVFLLEMHEKTVALIFGFLAQDDIFSDVHLTEKSNISTYFLFQESSIKKFLLLPGVPLSLQSIAEIFMEALESVPLESSAYKPKFLHLGNRFGYSLHFRRSSSLVVNSRACGTVVPGSQHNGGRCMQ